MSFGVNAGPCHHWKRAARICENSAKKNTLLKHTSCCSEQSLHCSCSETLQTLTFWTNEGEQKTVSREQRHFRSPTSSSNIMKFPKKTYTMIFLNFVVVVVFLIAHSLLQLCVQTELAANCGRCPLVPSPGPPTSASVCRGSRTVTVATYRTE